VFRVQDDIAGAVVSALKVQLLPRQAMTSARRSDDPVAYEQFLLGNEFIKRNDEPGWRKAREAYRQAIARDPGFGAAYAGLSSAEGNLADRLGDQPLMAQAMADADKAIALAPDLADGYSVRGISRLSFQKDWNGGRADLEKALALNPGDGQVQLSYGRLMVALGRVDEALAANRHAVELDPLAPLAWAQLGRAYNFVGRYPEARQALDRSIDLSPTFDMALFHRGMNDLLQGHAATALPYFRRAAGGYGGAGVAMAEYTLGHARESQAAMDAEIAGYAQGAAYQIAQAYAWRGERDQAFAWLERAYVQKDGGLTFLKMDPMIARIADDPRYAALLKKLGLPA
jgi:serine/threonine-protein kinase